MSQDKYHYKNSFSHEDLVSYPSGTTNMNISTYSLSSDPFGDRPSSMFNNDVSIRTPTDTAFTSISDSINSKGFHPNRNPITTTTNSDGYSTSAQSASSGSSKDKKGQNRKTRAVGRGGAGNIINTDKLQVDYVDEADILRRRQLLAQLNPRAKISNTGRGGSGNILAASVSAPYDRSKDPDDDYEKLVQLEARRKKMHEVVSTGRGGAGNVQNHVVVDAGGGVRPRSKSLGTSNVNAKKKIKGSALTSRPSTASTIASNASLEYYELHEYRLAPPPVTGIANRSFNQHAPINPNTPSTTPPPSTMSHNSHSLGPSRIDHNQTPTPAPNQPQRLAVSSAPPAKPVWRLQYHKHQQQPETSRHLEKTGKEDTLHDKDKEKKTGKGKWWKRSRKSSNEEYVQIEHAHTDQRSEPLRRYLHGIATNDFTQKEAGSPYHPPTSIPSTDGIPRIPMRNPQIPSHVSPEQDPRSLSPAESQILDEVRMLAESKAHRNGHFDMHDLEEILLQARHRHQNTPAAYDPHSLPPQSTLPQLSQFPLTPPLTISPTAWHPSHLQNLPNQEQQHIHTRGHPGRLHRKERMIGEEFIDLPVSSANRLIPTRDHHLHATAAPPSSFYPHPSTVYHLPSSTVSDGDISEYSSVMSFERDTQNISSPSLKASRREWKTYEQLAEPPSPAMHAPVRTKNVVKQKSDSAMLYYDNGNQEDNYPSEVVSELHKCQLALMAVHEEKNLKPVVVNEEGGSWSLDPVNEEDGDGLEFIEDEEPYSSFIDL